MIKQLVAIYASILTCAPCQAVYLSNDGVGQALIYPYYTTQTSHGDAQNTLISLVNSTASSKAVRVRFREASEGQAVASFNVYLGPEDAWTMVLIPDPQTGGTRLVSFDRSCISGPFLVNGTQRELEFSTAGGSFERNREGWLEVLEMGTLTGASATAASTSPSGLPNNCDALSTSSSVTVAAPSGGLHGGLTILNVANGLDFSVNAVAMANLARSPFFRDAGDPYPDFNANEIDPVSIVTANGSVYRSEWERPIDAVTASLMRITWGGEFVLDWNTRSQTDVVMTFPTRHFYVSRTVQAPFSESCAEPPGPLSGEGATMAIASRDGPIGEMSNTVVSFRCTSAAVFGFTTSNTAMFPTSVLGSRRLAWTLPPGGAVLIPSGIVNGSFLATAVGRTLTSLETSTRMNLTSGQSHAGPHVFSGYPIVGFAVRTFENGTLTCGERACQGNYGGAFPLKYTRSIN